VRVECDVINVCVQRWHSSGLSSLQTFCVCVLRCWQRTAVIS